MDRVLHTCTYQSVELVSRVHHHNEWLNTQILSQVKCQFQKVTQIKESPPLRSLTCELDSAIRAKKAVPKKMSETGPAMSQSIYVVVSCVRGHQTSDITS